MEDWVNDLCGARVRFPTAALACVVLPIDHWSDLPGTRGQLQWLVHPKLLKAAKG